MTKLPEPTADIYKMLDDAGLNAADLLMTRTSMTKKVEAIRGSIVRQFKDYIEAREALIIKEKKNAKV